MEKFYDTSTESRLRGVIENPKEEGDDESRLLKIMLRSEQAVFEVIIAPGWFMTKQSLNLQKNHVIEVIGSFIRVSGKACLLAREILHKNQKYFIRDPYGQPLWEIYKKSRGQSDDSVI